MSGEGFISARSPRWQFDQRPGELEATRAPRSGLMVCGSRGNVNAGWSVLVLANCEGGCFGQVVLSIEDARAAAEEIQKMCDVLEGRVW